MKIKARFRRRASANESIATLNAALVSALSRLDGLVADSATVIRAPLDTGSGESASVDLSPGLIAPISGAISYASRLPRAVVDRATSDDVLVLAFDSDAVDVVRFSSQVFPEIVKIFSPYRAAVVDDLDRELDDHELIVQESQRTGSDVDGRDTVWRFHPVNYFDNVLCLRAFGMNATEVVARLNDLSAVARVLGTGVLVVIGKKERTESVKLESEIRKRLGMTSRE